MTGVDVVVEVTTDSPYSDSVAEAEDIATGETSLAAVRRKVGRTEITHQEDGSLMMMIMKMSG